jgi:hypothetical protein
MRRQGQQAGAARGRASGRGLAALVALAALTLVLPDGAAALDADLKGHAIFKVSATNGYSILVAAASERRDGRGDLALIAYRNGRSVSYAVPATVTPTRLEANLGRLGRIALDIAPTGSERRVRSRCSGESVAVEPDRYRGTFEFRGEEGYATATATALNEYTRFQVDIFCPAHEPESGSARAVTLRVVSGRGHRQVDLRLQAARPGARPTFEADVREKRGRIEIQRSVSGRAPADAFAYDDLLATARVDPPAPFSGHGAFSRDAAPANRWRGNLAVDFPGRSNVSLAAPAARATLTSPAFPTG